MKKSVLNIAWLLLGILAVSASLISLGKRDAAADPRIDSFGPSGLSAFGNLLRSNGYRVQVTDQTAPALSADDVAIVCLNPDNHKSIEEDSTGIYRQLSTFVQKGGRLLALPFQPDFSSHIAKDRSTSNTVKKGSYKLKVADDSFFENVQYLLPKDLPTATIWQLSGSPAPKFAALMRYEKGTLMAVADGYIACNRDIDQAQNADVLMSIVQTIAPKGSRLVFTEAAFTNSEPGLMETLGPGAVGIWYQSLFLFVVIVFTLGKRFGLPEELRFRQSGQRELVDAIADTYRRAHATRIACRSTYDRADTEVRKALKLSSDAPASERDFRVPTELASAFRRVFEATIDSLSAQDALARCQRLRQQVKAFLNRDL